MYPPWHIASPLPGKLIKWYFKSVITAHDEVMLGLVQAHRRTEELAQKEVWLTSVVHPKASDKFLAAEQSELFTTS
jgi:hypothetical protein